MGRSPDDRNRTADSGVALAAAAALKDDRYGCGFSLWIVVITLLSPLAWPQCLVCLVPLYVGIAAANHEIELPRRVLNLAGASYIAALFMGGPLDFLSRALAHSISGHIHASYFLPAEAAFVSLACAYFAAICATFWMASSGKVARAADVRIPAATQKMLPASAHVSN
jgi:hypothetical protein